MTSVSDHDIRDLIYGAKLILEVVHINPTLRAHYVLAVGYDFGRSFTVMDPFYGKTKYYLSEVKSILIFVNI
jgi:hypothetical protein